MDGGCYDCLLGAGREEFMQGLFDMVTVGAGVEVSG